MTYPSSHLFGKFCHLCGCPKPSWSSFATPIRNKNAVSELPVESMFTAFFPEHYSRSLLYRSNDLIQASVLTFFADPSNLYGKLCRYDIRSEFCEKQQLFINIVPFDHNHYPRITIIEFINQDRTKVLERVLVTGHVDLYYSCDKTHFWITAQRAATKSNLEINMLFRIGFDPKMEDDPDDAIRSVFYKEDWREIREQKLTPVYYQI